MERPLELCRRPAPLRQRLAYHPSPAVGPADAAIASIAQKPPSLGSVLQSPMHRIPADSLPPLHGPPISELVEIPAYIAGQLISRSTLRHALPDGKEPPACSPFAS